MALSRKASGLLAHLGPGAALLALALAVLALATVGSVSGSARAEEGPAPCVPVSTQDVTCDRVDDDCDGVADDDVAPVPTSCGPAGACPTGIGEILCIDGNLVNTCDPLAEGPQVLVQFDSAMRHTSNVAGEAEVPLVELGGDMVYLANTSAPAGITGMEWTARDFDDSTWAEGSFGVGHQTAPPGATPLIQTAVPAGTFSVLTRKRFTLPDPSLARVMFVHADYDDGYVV